MSIIVEQAEALAARGDAGAALRLLGPAAEAGDVDALFTLAVWRLAGQHVPRDVPAARKALRRAVEIGHVDAALMEIALVANGSGGAADWPVALALLRTAARGDHVAAAQLALVEAMALRPDGGPVAVPPAQRLSESPDVRLFPGLFTPAECAHIAATARDLLAPSDVIDPATGRFIRHPVRTSDGAVIGPAREDLVIRALNRRIAAASGTDVAAGEALAVLRYAPGQQYHPHHDALPADAANQRHWTMLVYLNQGYGGGETAFLANGLKVRGRQGDGLLFRNVDDAGAPDPMSRHAGLPVTSGHKWLCTRWIRERPFDPWASGGN